MPFQCDLGIHEWKREYLTSNSCRIQEKCSRCGTVKGQITEFHAHWRAEYLGSNSCMMQERCVRCGEVRGQIAEVHPQWKREYLSSNSCFMQEKCVRCGQGRGNVVEFHEEWARGYLSANSCTHQVRCSRCGKVRGRPMELHVWEWIEKDPCLRVQICTRCGATGQIDQKDHSWKTIYKPNSYDIQEICGRCGVARARMSALSKFLGQDKIKTTLLTLIAAAFQKGESLHHILLCGPNGMGKVTLAKLLAADLGVNIKIISGKALDSAGELVPILTSLRTGDVLIIEEIESMRKQTLDVLVPALTDFSLDIVIGKGAATRSIKLKLPHFTLIGTTSKSPQVDERLESLMFVLELSPYDKDELSKIISLYAAEQGIKLVEEAAGFLAEQSNGCPGEALLVLKKVHQYALAYADGQITSTIATSALEVFGSKSNSPQYQRQAIPDDVKMFVWQRDGGHCVRCGSQENLEYDHIIPVSKGGSNTSRNIQILCQNCNRSKGANLA
jgi:Holliday junction DNA helicase RuvB subunit